ncbi:MAG TPA: hypothetical protein DCE42_25530 [Myxococcales bacterium]|nr:hypothetical protein [Deltaproteobacteria bacterium]MBU47915.1 hypothetical protein [Deltaproteobacteria bacterium]HAA58150.1 hypothetical protein [Myxococcales bacterium]|tara:strand:+ start:269 stop:4879 length:4611 start_codon:yes stop_codon:yes gene_type:complete
MEENTLTSSSTTLTLETLSTQDTIKHQTFKSPERVGKPGATKHIDGKTIFQDCEFVDDLQFYNISFTQLTFQDCTFRQSLQLNRFQAIGQVSFTNCTFHGDFKLQYTEHDNPRHLQSGWLWEECTFHQHTSIIPKSKGTLRGECTFRNCRLNDIDFGQSILQESCLFEDCKIDGELNIGNKKGERSQFTTFKKNLMLRNCELVGEVVGQAVSIGRALFIEECTFHSLFQASRLNSKADEVSQPITTKIEHSTFKKDVLLENNELGFVELHHNTFAATFSLNQTDIKKNFTTANTTFKELDFSRAVFSAQCKFYNVTFQGDLNIGNKERQSAQYTIFEKGFYLDECRVLGEFVGKGVKIAHGCSFAKTHFSDTVDLSQLNRTAPPKTTTATEDTQEQTTALPETEPTETTTANVGEIPPLTPFANIETPAPFGELQTSSPALDSIFGSSTQGLTSTTNKDATKKEKVYSCSLNIKKCVFEQEVTFSEASLKTCSLEECEFRGTFDFTSVEVKGAMTSQYVAFLKKADFTHTTFHGLARFGEPPDTRKVVKKLEEGKRLATTFHNAAWFAKTNFHDLADFSECIFYGNVNWSEATFGEIIPKERQRQKVHDFRNTKFYGEVDFHRTKMASSIDFSVTNKKYRSGTFFQKRALFQFLPAEGYANKTLRLWFGGAILVAPHFHAEIDILDLKNVEIGIQRGPEETDLAAVFEQQNQRPMLHLQLNKSKARLIGAQIHDMTIQFAASDPQAETRPFTCSLMAKETTFQGVSFQGRPSHVDAIQLNLRDCLLEECHFKDLHVSEDLILANCTIKNSHLQRVTVEKMLDLQNTKISGKESLHPFMDQVYCQATEESEKLSLCRLDGAFLQHTRIVHSSFNQMDLRAARVEDSTFYDVEIEHFRVWRLPKDNGLQLYAYVPANHRLLRANATELYTGRPEHGAGARALYKATWSADHKSSREQLFGNIQWERVFDNDALATETNNLTPPDFFIIDAPAETLFQEEVQDKTPTTPEDEHDESQEELSDVASLEEASSPETTATKSSLQETIEGWLASQTTIELTGLHAPKRWVQSRIRKHFTPGQMKSIRMRECTFGAVYDGASRLSSSEGADFEQSLTHIMNSELGKLLTKPTFEDLEMTSCRLYAPIFQHAVFWGDFLMEEVCQIHTDGLFRACDFSGDVALTDIDINSKGLFEDAQFRKSLRIHDVTLKRGLSFRGSSFSDDVYLQHISLGQRTENVSEEEKPLDLDFSYASFSRALHLKDLLSQTATLPAKNQQRKYTLSFARADLAQLSLPPHVDDVIQFGYVDVSDELDPSKREIQTQKHLQQARFCVLLSTACMEEGRIPEGIAYLVRHKNERMRAYGDHLWSVRRQHPLQSDLYAQLALEEQSYWSATDDKQIIQAGAAYQNVHNTKPGLLGLFGNIGKFIKLVFQKYYYNHGAAPARILFWMVLLALLVLPLYVFGKLSFQQAALESIKATLLPLSVLIPGLQNLLSLKPLSTSIPWVFHVQTVLNSAMLVHFFSIKFPELGVRARMSKLKADRRE